jgi:hypothetical protein
MERTYYQRRRCRKTGTHIVVCPSRDEVAEDEATENPWMTICDEHGTCICHETLELARSWAVDPDWCEECQDLMKEGKKHHAA